MATLLAPQTPGLHAQSPLARWLAEPAIARAAEHLARGGLLGLPTETVYGLAADAGQPEAVARIYRAKGRPSDHPLIVHLPPAWARGLAHHARDVPPWAQALMHAFWPGPLTLILPRRSGVAEAAAGGQPSVGLRCPAHPAAQALLCAAQSLGVHGTAAPSANRFGRVSPTTAAHVLDEFPTLSELLVLDGGPCPVGIESTILDATGPEPVLLRPGQLTAAELAAACGQPILTPEQARQAGRPTAKAAGTLASHYAPRARVRLWPSAALQAATAEPLPHPASPGPQTLTVAVYARSPAPVAMPAWLAPGSHPPAHLCHWQPMPPTAAACAHELFAVLRGLDALGVSQIWVEEPPPGAQWDGVRDRLRRAAA